jgi:hypothetical protein
MVMPPGAGLKSHETKDVSHRRTVKSAAMLGQSPEIVIDRHFAALHEIARHGFCPIGKEFQRGSHCRILGQQPGKVFTA